jgi:hypothetical protein
LLLLMFLLLPSSWSLTGNFRRLRQVDGNTSFNCWMQAAAAVMNVTVMYTMWHRAAIKMFHYFLLSYYKAKLVWRKRELVFTYVHMYLEIVIIFSC